MPALVCFAVALAAAACTGSVGDSADDTSRPGTGPDVSGGPGASSTPGAQTPQGGAASPMGTGGTQGGVGPGPSTSAVAETAFYRLTDVEVANSAADLLGVPRAARTTPLAQVAPAASGFVLAAAVDGPRLFDLTTTVEGFAATAMKAPTALLGCDVAAANDAACVAGFIARFGKRAFRRPLTSDEQAAYLALYTSVRDRLDRKSGVEALLRAFLLSPHFLYLVEGLGAPAAAKDTAPLSSYEVAARLSFLLWSTVPDDELLAAADRGELTSPDKIAAQVTRMLGRRDLAAAGLARFHHEWLELGDYPNGELALAVANETDALLADVVLARDGRLATLLTAPNTFINARLATFYGVPAPAAPTPNDFASAGLPATRKGLLLLPMFLGSHASATASPIKRGKLLRQRLFCQEPPPPPPDVNVSPPPPSAATSTREKLLAHRTNPACAGCHSFIEPLGFGLENFDENGKYRTMDGGKPVDASGAITGTTDADGPFDGALAMVDRLARSAQVSDCVATQWYRFAFHRTDDAADTTDLAAAKHALGGPNGVRDLLLAIAQSPSFRTRRVVAP